MADVAALAGVSLQTVSRVINGHAHVAPDTRVRVERAIVELAYRPNSAARALVTGSARTIGLIVFNICQYGPAQTMLGLERAAREAGYHVSIAVLDEATAGAMQEAVERLASQSVDAIVALATYADALAAVREVQTHIPLLTVQAQADVGLAVWVDQEVGARLATGHLLSLGHRTVHHVGGPVESLDAHHRVEGWQGELTDSGVRPPDPVRGDWTASSGYRAGVRLLCEHGTAAGTRPTAIFVGNDQMALGVLKALHEAGLAVPGDVSVVGFDDIPEAAVFTPALTTVRQDFAEVGRRGLDLALSVSRRSSVAVEPAVAPVLVERESAAPVR
jgi:DNA-binding LacI/PurR family transcriptional regulator